MRIFISESARLTKSLRGATAYEAKSTVKVDDDDHESNIKKGEKFYLKKLGKKHYVIDLEKEGGKTVYYQFAVDEATYDKLAKKHTNTDDAPGMKEKREQAAGRKATQNKKASVGLKYTPAKGKHDNVDPKIKKKLRKEFETEIKELRKTGQHFVGKPGLKKAKAAFKKAMDLAEKAGKAKDGKGKIAQRADTKKTQNKKKIVTGILKNKKYQELGMGDSANQSAMLDAFKGKTHDQRVKAIKKSNLGLFEWDEDDDISEKEHNATLAKIKSELIDLSKNMNKGDKLSDFGLDYL